MTYRQKRTPEPGTARHSVRYGCAHWNCADELLTRTEAWRLFYEYREAPPAIGEHAADYINIEDELGQVLEAWSKK